MAFLMMEKESKKLSLQENKDVLARRIVESQKSLEELRSSNKLAIMDEDHGLPGEDKNKLNKK